MPRKLFKYFGCETIDPVEIIAAVAVMLADSALNSIFSDKTTANESWNGLFEFQILSITNPYSSSRESKLCDLG
jgi:hypothetical protein